MSFHDLLKDDKVRRDLGWPFEFDLSRAEPNFTWLTVSPAPEVECIAGDSEGGLFLACGNGSVETRDIIYASSDGQTGRLAGNLKTLIEFIVAVPYWRSLLQFSGGGQIDEMRRAAPYLEAKARDETPEVSAARERLLDRLSLQLPADPIAALHHSLTTSEYVVEDEHGGAYATLFGPFTAADNPAWK